MDDNKKQWIKRGAAIAAVAVVILIIVLNSVKNTREKGSLVANRNLAAEVFGESAENRMKNKGVKEEKAPENAKSYAILVFDSKGKVKNYFTRGLDASKEWTEEELLSVDCIVFAFYDFSTHTYNETENGRTTGKTARVTTDKYDMYYYNPASDAVFKADTLSSGGLPSQTTNPKSTRVTDSMLIRTVKGAIGMFYIPPSVWAVGAVVIVTCGLMTLFIVLSVKKMKNKRA